jgi:hypothetical protein
VLIVSTLNLFRIYIYLQIETFIPITLYSPLGLFGFYNGQLGFCIRYNFCLFLNNKIMFIGRENTEIKKI